MIFSVTLFLNVVRRRRYVRDYKCVFYKAIKEQTGLQQIRLIHYYNIVYTVIQLNFRYQLTSMAILQPCMAVAA